MGEDASKAIMAWTLHISVPKWTENDNCRQCDRRLQRSRSHNCRLCGHKFCSLCTAKYHIPNEFKRKAKTGPSRCCFGCVQGCLDERWFFEKETAGLQKRRPGMRTQEVDGVLHIFPPVWFECGKLPDCHLCERTAGQKGYNCRTCGSVYCKDCTVKIEVPEQFRPPKKKLARVCLRCRFDIIGGAVLDPKNYSGTPELEGHLTNHASREGSICGPSIAYPGESPAFPMVMLKVQWECASLDLTVLHIRSDTSLDMIHERFCQEVPNFNNRSFEYLCRSRPVHRDHWDIFTAQQFLPVLRLREAPAPVLSNRIMDFSISSDHAPQLQSFGLSTSMSNENILVNRHVPLLTRSLSKSLCLGSGPTLAQPDVIGRVKAMFSLESTRDNFLSFEQNEVVDLLIRKPLSKWWFGQVVRNGVIRKGWIPSNYFTNEIDP